jgi:hypothetical protein
MVSNRSVPADVILPHISYRNVAEASRWLAAVFGFEEHYRYGAPNGARPFTPGLAAPRPTGSGSSA